MVRTNNKLKKPKKEMTEFHLRDYGWSSKKTMRERLVALIYARGNIEGEVMKDRMLRISQWNKKMCYDTFMYWRRDLSYGEMWYLEHACDLIKALTDA